MVVRVPEGDEAVERHAAEAAHIEHDILLLDALQADSGGREPRNALARAVERLVGAEGPDAAEPPLPELLTDEDRLPGLGTDANAEQRSRHHGHADPARSGQPATIRMGTPTGPAAQNQK